jgi:hypothetical protein
VDKEKDEEMEFQDAKRSLKAVYGNSESSNNEHRKALHAMLGVPGTLRPGASSRHCAEKLRRRLRQKQRCTASGWR